MAATYELAVVRLFVHDWERALRFYTETLCMTLRHRADEFGWAEFDVGPCGLAVERLAPDDPEAADLVGRYVGVSLRVPDLQGRYRALVERGVEFLAPPEKQTWGGTLAHLRDPEGNVLTLLG
jgi:catechol 2,3-dioxygenase-like lactoylglutathione lyase family enzyme